jgi:hypothetical protein
MNQFKVPGSIGVYNGEGQFFMYLNKCIVNIFIIQNCKGMKTLRRVASLGSAALKHFKFG